jgi:hypothetical protein
MVRDEARIGRRPIWTDRSAIRADRLADRIEEKVAAASTNVPAAVANDATVPNR